MSTVYDGELDIAEIKASLLDLDPDGVDYVIKESLRKLAREQDNPESFACFYQLIHGNELPVHGWRWIEQIYKAKGANKGALIFAWRGSWKTTTISMTFTAYRIGKNPERANLIIQANDSSANKTTQSIAELIEHNAEWRHVFPNIVPDPDLGWGANGYEVKDSSIDYEDWRSKCSARNDPTLLGLGIRSKSLIGKHPDGVMLLDDIHDEENTSSDLENQTVKNKVTGTIMPFIVEDGEEMLTWTIGVGTPWRDDDAYHMMRKSGEWEFFNLALLTPVLDEDEACDWEYDGSDFSDLFGRWVINWKEQVTPNVVLRYRRRSGMRDFARMYLLNLELSRETGLPFQHYPSEYVDPTWQYSAGCDFASVRDRFVSKVQLKNRTYFALCYGAKLPTGGAVVTGGLHGHYTQAQGEAAIEKIQNVFANFTTTVIEDDGKGEEFVNVLLRKPHLKIRPMLTRGVAKRTRQEKMGAWLETGVVKISDADTPFLNLLRAALDNYPDGNDDVRDALYWFLRSIPEVLVIPSGEGEADLPEPKMPDRKKHKNFIQAMAKM